MNDKTALVLAGGGSLGAVQVGMLQVLIEANVAIGVLLATGFGCACKAPPRGLMALPHLLVWGRCR